MSVRYMNDGLTARELTDWLSELDQDEPLVLAFRSEKGVLWRFAHDLTFALFADSFFDPEGQRPAGVIEINVTGEFEVIPA
jgi:hypothetical protein